MYLDMPIFSIISLLTSELLLFPSIIFLCSPHTFILLSLATPIATPSKANICEIEQF